jgi:aspartate/methionine/tyrosine aminotransferase
MIPCSMAYVTHVIVLQHVDDFSTSPAETRIALVVDETYRDFVPPSPSRAPGAGDRGKPHDLFDEADWDETLVSLFSFSKSYKIPGYRLGGIVASRTVLEACRTVADCIQASFRRNRVSLV